MLPAEGTGVGGTGRVRTLRQYDGLRLQAVPLAGGGEGFAVTQDETVTLGRFDTLERATVCFEAARAALIAGTVTGAGGAPTEAPPPNITDLDAYRRRRPR